MLGNKVSTILAWCALAFTSAAMSAGTTLSVSFGDATIVCDGSGSAFVSFDWTVTSTGSADSAVLTASIDGGTPIALGTIASGNVTGGGGWTFAGRMKTADSSYTTTLANGVHSFQVCATQSGANGNQNKMSCTTQSVTVNCQSTDPCANETVHGELTGQADNICGNNPINVQFSGFFGPAPTMTISGPSGTLLSTPVLRNGSSCQYNYQWDKAGNTGAGSYVFSMNGNGQSIEFPKTFECKVNGKSQDD
jgi:hypothetical protein